MRCGVSSLSGEVCMSLGLLLMVVLTLVQKVTLFVVIETVRTKIEKGLQILLTP